MMPNVDERISKGHEGIKKLEIGDTIFGIRGQISTIWPRIQFWEQEVQSIVFNDSRTVLVDYYTKEPLELKILWTDEEITDIWETLNNGGLYLVEINSVEWRSVSIGEMKINKKSLFHIMTDNLATTAMELVQQ